MAKLWTLRKISEDLSDAPAVQGMVKDACLENLFQLVALRAIDIDVAAASAEVTVTSFEMSMKEAGYEPPAPFPPIKKENGKVDMVAALEKKKQDACRIMHYALTGYMMARDLRENEEDI